MSEIVIQVIMNDSEYSIFIIYYFITLFFTFIKLEYSS